MFYSEEKDKLHKNIMKPQAYVTIKPLKIETAYFSDIYQIS